MGVPCPKTLAKLSADPFANKSSMSKQAAIVPSLSPAARFDRGPTIWSALQFMPELDILLDIAVEADSGQYTSETRDQELSEASPQAGDGPVRGSGARRRPRPHPIAGPALGRGRARRLATSGCSQPNNFRRATQERRHS